MSKEKKTTKREGKRKTPKKPARNYVIYIVIILLTVLLVWYLCDWYKTYQDYQRTIPVVRGVIPEITDQELDHYLMENEDTVLYFCTAEESDCRDFESKLKSLVTKQKLKDEMTYVNLSETKDRDAFFSQFNAKYPYVEKLNTYPAIVYFKDGKVENLIEGTKEAPLTIDRFQQFLDVYQIGKDA